jgi:hypothetical protein
MQALWKRACQRTGILPSFRREQDRSTNIASNLELMVQRERSRCGPP